MRDRARIANMTHNMSASASFASRLGAGLLGLVSITVHAIEAPTGYDGLSNGYLTQQSYKEALAEFNLVQTIPTGLGPVFNDSSCQSCHRGPVDGGTSHTKVTRAGYFDGVNFMDPPGGSLIPSRAIDPSIQARVPRDANVRTTRTSLSTLGDGYIEAIPDSAIIKIAKSQPSLSKGLIKGEYLMVDILEAPGKQAVGKFGWKAQHASLVSFSADAYRNEMGITTPLFPTEATSNGRSVDRFESVGQPNDSNDGVILAANFMRSTKAPARTPGSPDPKQPNQSQTARQAALKQGERVFERTGCGLCHTATFVTAATGTVINGGAYSVPAALGSVTFHPYSDFLLHDIGTGDGIVQNGGQSTRNKIRTMPLWGLSKHRMFLHDGSAVTVQDAVKRHSGEASAVVAAFRRLSAQDNQAIMGFLNSL